MAKDEELKGLVTRDNAAGIKAVLEDAKADGHRFVAFELKKGALNPEQIQSFNSALPALEYAAKQWLEHSFLTVRSVAVMEKEVERVLEGKRDLQLEGEKGPGRSKGAEIER